MNPFSGTYKGLGRDVELVLRLDIDGNSPLNMLSGELNQSVELKQYNYFNLRQHSFIGDDILRDEKGNSLMITTPIRFYRLPELTGTMEVEMRASSAVARVELTGYGYHNHMLTFSLEKTSNYFRSVRLEVDLEKGTTYPGSYKPWETDSINIPAGMSPEPINIQRAYQRAGIEMIVHPHHSTIPNADTGVDGRWTSAELHAAMMNYFSLVANEPSWNVYLMVGERFVNPGVSGIMFDSTDPLPRQGAAIFYSHYRNLPPGIKERNFVRTAVHEIGHAMNLLHSFQKGVFSEFGFGDNPFMMPRSDSLSYMNYPWRYPHGHNKPPGWDGTPDYWSRFNFNFDATELMHLRHHDRSEVIFGGEAFGIHGHNRVANLEHPEITKSNEQSPLTLELRGKRVKEEEVRAFELMEPVHLELKMACKGEQEVNVIDQLDPNKGVVGIYIQRPSGDVVQFRPLMTMCQEKIPETILKPRVPLYQDIHLTFGKEGFYFQEPGVYLIRAVYLGGESRTSYSNVLSLRVAAPRTAEQDHLAANFFDPINGHLLAVGPSGSAQFTRNIDFFRELVEKMPDTAVSKTLAAYLGMVDGIPFKDVRHRQTIEGGIPIRQSVMTCTKPDSKQALKYLDQALAKSESVFQGLPNLETRQLWIDRAHIHEACGDIKLARETIDQACEFVKETIVSNEALRRREIMRMETIKNELGGIRSAVA